MHSFVMKLCRKCGNTKPLDQFSPDKGTNDGLYAHCKTCHNEYFKNRFLTNPTALKKKR